MKRLLNLIFVLLLISFQLSANLDSLKTDSSRIGKQAQITYSSKLFVYDAADLLNPTLHSKFESELNEYKAKNDITIRLICLPQTDSTSLDQRLKDYLEKTDDVVVIIAPRYKDKTGQIHIHTINQATRMVSSDSCRLIEAHIRSTWLADDQYEAAAIEAIGRIKEQIKEYKQFERNPLNTAAMAVGILVLAIVLYKFSTASFKESKKKMSKKNILEQ